MRICDGARPYAMTTDERSSVLPAMPEHDEPPASRPEATGTREALIASGLRCFAERGYAGSRLTDIAKGAGLTTGAFYRHFGGKLDFFDQLLGRYGDDLQGTLNAAGDLAGQVEAWIEVSRRHRGVVRAAAELTRAGTEAAASRRRLRDATASLLARHLPPQPSWRETRAATLMLVDVLDQYVLMEASGWIPERPPRTIAAHVEHLVVTGLYGAPDPGAG